jgi:uncharacterized membrane protein
MSRRIGAERDAADRPAGSSLPVRFARVAAFAALIALPVLAWSTRFGSAPALGTALGNAAVGTIFALSLRQRESLVERFARAAGDTGEAVQRYCRRLTVVWALWLWLLAAAGLAIALAGHVRLAAWWAGAIDYGLIAALFVGEHAWRRVSGRAAPGLVRQMRAMRTALHDGVLPPAPIEETRR